MARDARFRRHRQDGAGVRPDERAAGRARPRGPHRRHHGGVLPRSGGPGRPPVHRQRLSLHPGQHGGIGPARPHAFGCGLPTDPGHRHGRPGGAHYLHQAGLHHLLPSDLRARRRLHGPGHRHNLRAPGRGDRPGARHRGDGDLPGRGPADFLLAYPGPADRGGGAL